MPESYSVKAVLSAADQGFTSTMKSAMGYANNLKSTLASGLGLGALMGIGQQAMSAVTGSLSNLGSEVISTSDSMQKLQQAMRFSGYAESEIERIAGATGTLKTYADKTVFALEDVMSTYGALSANGIKDADKMTEAVGNAVAVFGGGAQEYSSVGLAFSQAMASGALHAQDWNQILNASPQLAGGLRKELIKLNPKLGKDFKSAMEDGAITAELLGEAMSNIGMTDMAKEAAQSVTTFEGAMGNLEATVSSGMMNLYDSFAKSSVIDAINGFNGIVGKGFDWLAVKIPAAIDAVKPYWDAFSEDAKEVGSAFGDAFSAISGSLGELNGSFGSAANVSSFTSAMDTAKDALVTFAGFLEEHSDTIAEVLALLPKLYVAYKGFKIVSAVAPFVGTFSKAILGLAGKGVSKISGRLFGISKGQEAVGESSMSSSRELMNSAKAFVMMGAGILLISAGFFLLAQSAVAVADSGGAAVAVLFGLIGAVALLGAGMMKMMQSAKGSTKELASISTAFLALGASILLISAGFWILSDAAVNLANAGPAAIATMFGMVVAIGALMVVAKTVGSALTAGAVGFLAFGAALILAGAGMTIMTNAAINLANAGPLAIGVMVGMVAAIALLAAGAAAIGPALTLGAVGFLAFGAAIVLVGVGAVLAAAALAIIASVLPTVSEYGLSGAVSIAALGASMIVFATGATLAGMAAIILGVGLTVAAAGLTLMGGGATIAAAGMLMLALSLKSVNSSMKSIASNAKTANKSITSMKSSVNIINEGLDALGNKAKSAVNKFINAFDGSVGKAKSAGKALGDGVRSGAQVGLTQLPNVATSNMNKFNSGLISGGNKAKTTARSMSTSIVSSMNSASGGSYKCGYYIGIGLANGMRSTLGEVRSVAAQLAAAAEAAVRAKAKIHSPSRVSDGLGWFWGKGLANGLWDTVGLVWDAAKELVMIPTLAMADAQMPSLAGIAEMELDENYNYYSSATYTIVVPVEVEGREIAKATAVYDEEERTKLQKRNNRRSGIR